MGSNGSFYQNGLPLSTLETGLGNVPPAGVPAPKTAESSFYLSGSAYVESNPAIAQAFADSATASAAAAAASAASAASSLAVLNTTALLKAQNLADLSNVATAKINLSLVKSDVGLGNVDNTSDVNKPVSTAQATADALVASNAAAATALKANIASPTLTGVPAAPTAAPGTNTTQLATTAFVDAARVILAAATALKADIASPTLTGTPAAPTATAGTNTTQLATTAFVEAARVILAAADALKAPLASPALTGTPTAPTAAVDTNTTQLATTAMVLAQAASATPLIDGTAAVGTSTRFARGDHVHPTDTTRAPLASPGLTGVPTAPTATVGTNTTQLATTAFVLANSAASAANGEVSILYYTTTQTITIPTGATRAFIRLWAPGGGSGGISTTGSSPGGGGGSSLEKYLTGLTAGNTLALTVGAVGAAGAATPTAGGTGGVTTLASGTQTISTLTTNGGVGSAAGGSSAVAGGAGGAISTGGDINIVGRAGSASTGATTGPGVGGGSPGSAMGGGGANGRTGSGAGNAGEAGGMIVAWLS